MHRWNWAECRPAQVDPQRTLNFLDSGRVAEQGTHLFDLGSRHFGQHVSLVSVVRHAGFEADLICVGNGSDIKAFAISSAVRAMPIGDHRVIEQELAKAVESPSLQPVVVRPA